MSFRPFSSQRLGLRVQVSDRFQVTSQWWCWSLHSPFLLLYPVYVCLDIYLTTLYQGATPTCREENQCMQLLPFVFDLLSCNALWETPLNSRKSCELARILLFNVKNKSSRHPLQIFSLPLNFIHKPWSWLLFSSSKENRRSASVSLSVRVCTCV